MFDVYFLRSWHVKCLYWYMIFAILIDFQQDLDYEHGKNCYMYVKLKIIEAIGFGLLYIHAGVTIILFTRNQCI